MSMPFSLPQIAGRTARLAIRGAALTMLSASLLALSPITTSAQPVPPHEPPAPSAMPPHKAATLTVSGQGRATAQPDLARISVGVSVQAETASEAMRQNTALQQAVIDQLKASGLEGRDIQTSALELSPVQSYPNDGKPPVVTGYRARNIVTLRLRDLSALGDVLDKIVESGANEINSISFELEDSSKIEDAARAKAVASARHRARVMAKASKQVLGPLISLSDSRVNNAPQPYMAARIASDSSAPVPIEAGELSFEAEVTAVYLLLPADAQEKSVKDGDE